MIDESVQMQLKLLQDQVRVLQVAVEHLPDQVAARMVAAQEAKHPLVAVHNGHSSYEETVGDETHSFLLDENLPNTAHHRGLSHDIAPEAQVQRLTAQLTAAYNRIAALEEQLLAQRLH